MGNDVVCIRTNFLGFGFLSFEDEDSVDRCVAEHFVNLNGKQVSFQPCHVIFRHGLLVGEFCH